MSESAVLVSGVGDAEGSLAIAAALACAGAEADRAALLIELADGRVPRPALVATAAARALEERLAAHLPEAPAAARGQICQLALPDGDAGLEMVSAALATSREATAVVHLPAAQLRGAVEPGSGFGIEADAVLLRADLSRDRALTGLAVRSLMDLGIAVAVQKRRLPWVPSRRALFGVLPAGSADALPERVVERCLGAPAAVGA